MKHRITSSFPRPLELSCGSIFLTLLLRATTISCLFRASRLKKDISGSNWDPSSLFQCLAQIIIVQQASTLLSLETLWFIAERSSRYLKPSLMSEDLLALQRGYFLSLSSIQKLPFNLIFALKYFINSGQIPKDISINKINWIKKREKEKKIEKELAIQKIKKLKKNNKKLLHRSKVKRKKES